MSFEVRIRALQSLRPGSLWDLDNKTGDVKWNDTKQAQPSREELEQRERDILSGAYVSPEDVNDERARRMRNGFVFGGKLFDFDLSISNYSGVHGMALQLDPEDGDLTWGGMLDADMSWIAKDNTSVPMDVDEFGRFMAAMLQYQTRLVLAARTLKDLEKIPGDYADDRHWN